MRADRDDRQAGRADGVADLGQQGADGGAGVDEVGEEAAGQAERGDQLVVPRRRW